MLNTREIIDNLSAADKRLFMRLRTAMRREYLKAHSELVGPNEYAEDDDAFLDFVDGRIAELFKRSGRDVPINPIRLTSDIDDDARLQELEKAVVGDGGNKALKGEPK